VYIKNIFYAFLFVLMTNMMDAYPVQGFEFDIESGAVFISYSDVQIPKSTGTLISLADELTTDPAFFIRGRLTYYINKQHMVSILIAPFKVEASGNIDRSVVFEGVLFDPGVTLHSVYKFNSYRLSYQYFRYLADNFYFGVGLTAKIRDAKISIADSTHESVKTNIGFVPLIKFNITWYFLEPLALVLDGDALAAPQGRAEDVSLAIHGNISRNMSLKSGFRVLEGGSDVEEVYSFTWVNYVFAGVQFRF
jgi:hypothetical protein